MGSSETEEFDHPGLQHFAERHGLEPQVLSELLENHGVPPALMGSLLQLAYAKYRTLAAWGGKAKYIQEVERLIRESSGEDEEST